LGGDQAPSSVTYTDLLERCVRKGCPKRFNKLADGFPGKIVVCARGAVDAPFSVCGDKRASIVTVPGIEMVLCNLDSIHCVDSSA
jgi:hypothetical protein